MQKREALREYVDAVCQYTQVYGFSGTVSATIQKVSGGAWSEYANPAAARSVTGDRLNAADGRLRALGMLP